MVRFMVLTSWSKQRVRRKDLFQGSVNRFFVKGEGNILYTHNNGKLANDPKLACQNFLSALERIPKVIATHEKELAKATKDIDVYKAISTGVWNKEDELRSIKAQAAELDRKIALTLNPPLGREYRERRATDKEYAGAERTAPEHRKWEYRWFFIGCFKDLKSASTYAQTSTTPKEEKQDIMSKVVFSRP